MVHNQTEHVVITILLDRRVTFKDLLFQQTLIYWIITTVGLYSLVDIGHF